MLFVFQAKTLTAPCVPSWANFFYFSQADAAFNILNLMHDIYFFNLNTHNLLCIFTWRRPSRSSFPWICARTRVVEHFAADQPPPRGPPRGRSWRIYRTAFYLMGNRHGNMLGIVQTALWQHASTYSEREVSMSPEQLGKIKYSLWFLISLNLYQTIRNQCWILRLCTYVPESLSVSVNTKDVVSLEARCPGARLGPADTQPSGWQKYTMSSGSGKSSWLVRG